MKNGDLCVFSDPVVGSLGNIIGVQCKISEVHI